MLKKDPPGYGYPPENPPGGKKWARLLKLIAPHYPRAGNGRTPMPLETMLRIYFLQQWFNLSDPAAEASQSFPSG